MKRLLLAVLLVSTAFAASTPNMLTTQEKAEGWQLLFDGRSLEGWQASEKPGTFSVADGCIVVHGPRSHLFYRGPVQNHSFTNFELSLEVMTLPKSNSGVFVHTAWQETGWPGQGYEVQVNNTQKDPSRTGGLYAVKNVATSIASDNVWFTLFVRVQGRRIIVQVDNKEVTDFTQPDNWTPPKGFPRRWFDSGTIALQAHDPDSEIHYRNIKIRPLPTTEPQR